LVTDGVKLLLLQAYQTQRGRSDATTMNSARRESSESNTNGHTEIIFTVYIALDK
jgi:hypothetical protein